MPETEFKNAPKSPMPVEPLRLLLNVFTSGATALLLRAESPAADWLTESEIVLGLRDALAEPVPVHAARIDANTWLIEIRLPVSCEDAAVTPQMYALARALSRHLEDGYRVSCVGCRGENADSEAIQNMPIPDTRYTIPAFFVLPIGILPKGEGLEENLAELNELLDTILNKRLGAQFQPIVDLRDGTTLGYEALIRGPKGRMLRRFGQMFHVANKASMVAWFDLACQEQCFARAAEAGLRKLLFVNMDAAGLAFLDLHERSLAIRAREAGLEPSQIVIEITERQAVEDFPKLIQYIAGLREEGFKIAIDDAGAGYNSLYTIAELRPDFVKIDRALVRNLEVRGERRALLAAMAQYARRIGTAVLAEGAETREELATLIDLGIAYGQGYLMGKPADDFRGVPKDTREFIRDRAELRDRTLVGTAPRLREIARKGLALPVETSLQFAAQKFLRDESLTSIVIVEKDAIRGIVPRSLFAHCLNRNDSASRDALPDLALSAWMQAIALQLDSRLPAQETARQVLTRSDISLDSDIVLTDEAGKFAGVAPIRALLDSANTAQENRQKYLDALTRLPGRVPLESEFIERLENRETFAVLRFDLAHLEPFNQRYGLTLGDGTLIGFARLLRETLAAQGNSEDYLAHLGGDNFLLLTRPDAAPRLQMAVRAAFEALIPQLHQPEEARRGWYELEERGGNTRQIPLLRLETACLTNEKRRFFSLGQVLDELNARLADSASQPKLRRAA